MVTINDVAKAAGVSSATVSRALSGGTPVSPATLARVNAAVEKLGYRRNSIGAALRQQRSKTLVLIIADIENPFLTTVIRGVERVARTHGYSLLLFNSDEDIARESDHLEVAHESRPAGVLITPVSNRTDVSSFLDAGVPVVGLDRPLADGRADSVLVETRSAARKAVEHLHKLGRRNIALITGPRGTYTADERLSGWQDGLTTIGASPSESLVRFTNYKVDGGRRAMEELLAETPVIDGLVLANSLLMLGALQVLQVRGLALQKDLDLVAFDDAPWTSLMGAPIMLVRQPAYDVGVAGAERIIQRINGEPTETARTTLLHPSVTKPATGTASLVQ